MISQREARKLQKRVRELEEAESLRRANWRSEWPGGVNVDTIEVCEGDDGEQVFSVNGERFTRLNDLADLFSADGTAAILPDAEDSAQPFKASVWRGTTEGERTGYIDPAPLGGCQNLHMVRFPDGTELCEDCKAVQTGGGQS